MRKVEWSSRRSAVTGLDASLDEAGVRPGSATCAAVLSVLVGVGTLIGSVLAGAAMELWVCAGYLFHALAVVAPDADEPSGVVVVFVAIPVVVAVAAVSSLLLAMRPMTAEYLLFSRRVAP